MLRNVAVYCGSHSGRDPLYEEAAKKLGNWLLSHDYGLVYGGASVGLMGTLAKEVMTGNGRVIGVMPAILAGREGSQAELTEFISVPDMHTRKKLMMDRADAFIALPGGCGTMEEIFEVITWSQIGAHHKPFAFYNVAGYYNELNAFIAHMKSEGFITPHYAEDILFSDSLEEISQHFTHYQSPQS